MIGWVPDTELLIYSICILSGKPLKTENKKTRSSKSIGQVISIPRPMILEYIIPAILLYDSSGYLFVILTGSLP